MVYECDQCHAALPARAMNCPKCGEAFDDAVPVDAEVPKRGFSAAPPPPTSPPPANAWAMPAQGKPAPPPKNGSGVNVGRVILLFFLLFGGGAYIMSTANNIEHGSLSSSDPASTFSTSHSVTYKVTGSTPSASLTFNNSGGDSQQISNAPLPWSQSFTMTSGTFMYISAQNDHGSGMIEVEIDVDGVVRKQSHSEGAYTIADTSETL